MCLLGAYALAFAAHAEWVLNEVAENILYNRTAHKNAEQDRGPYFSAEMQKRITYSIIQKKKKKKKPTS